MEIIVDNEISHRGTIILQNGNKYGLLLIMKTDLHPRFQQFTYRCMIIFLQSIVIIGALEIKSHFEFCGSHQTLTVSGIFLMVDFIANIYGPYLSISSEDSHNKMLQPMSNMSIGFSYLNTHYMEYIYKGLDFKASHIPAGKQISIILYGFGRWAYFAYRS